MLCVKECLKGSFSCALRIPLYAECFPAVVMVRIAHRTLSSRHTSHTSSVDGGCLLDIDSVALAFQRHESCHMAGTDRLDALLACSQMALKDQALRAAQVGQAVPP